jgi:hypothetical protein
MRAHFPDKPYTITKVMWDDYYFVQNSGRMNMMQHWAIGYFCSDSAWQKAHDHFETGGNRNDLVIE